MRKNFTLQVSSLVYCLAALTLQLSPVAQAQAPTTQSDTVTQSRKDEVPRDLALTNPAVKEGLKLRVVGRKIVIGTGALEVNGKLIPITQPTKVVVPSAGQFDMQDETVRFQDEDGKPTNSIVLPHCRATLNDNTILRYALVPGSLRLKAQPGRDGATFHADADYAVDVKFGAVTRNEAGQIKPGAKAYADYKTWRRRLDTIAFDPSDDSFVLVQGVPARSGPEPPQVAAPLIPLANVYVDWGNGDISPTDVMPITETVYEPDPKQVEHNLKAMAPLIKKLQNGDPINLVFWGDSVTMGYDARSKQDGYVHQFIQSIKTNFPKANLVVSNLGMSGSTSSFRLPILKIEVFGLKPDLIVVEFVGDLALPAHELQKDYEELLDQAKKTGASVILCTPNMASPKIARAYDWDAIADKPYISVLHELARNNANVALADVFGRWQHLPKEGLRPDILLVNGQNNPNNFGHQTYVEELMRCFVPAPDKVAQHQM